MRRSTFFRRMILMVLSGVILTSLLSLSLYIAIVRRVYENIRKDELLPIAYSIADIYADELESGADDSDSITQRLHEQDTRFFGANLYILSGDGEIISSIRNGPGFKDGIYRPSTSSAPGGAANATPSVNNDVPADAAGEPSAAAPVVAPPPVDDGGLPPDGSKPEGPPPIEQQGEAPPPPIDDQSDTQTMAGAEDISSIISSSFSDVASGGELVTTRQLICEDKDEASNYLVVGVPVETESGFSGAILLVQKADEISNKLTELTLTLVISAIISFFVMLYPSYHMAMRLAAPINEMRDVAKAMSSGDYSIRSNENHKGEIGELARSMNEFAEKSGQLEQTRRDYVANISHELRTPIASIRAMSETLRDGLLDDDDKKQRYYEHILRESMRLSRLVDDLLELSRLQSGGIALKKAALDLKPVLDAAATSFEQISHDADVSFAYDVPPVFPTVCGNGDRIEQVLVILLDNAVKHTPEGGVVTLGAQVMDDHVLITVSDTGCGIKPEDIDKIFDRFYKSDKSHSSGGTGLGLSIAREVLSLLGESISVESVVGEFTRFSFTVHFQ